MTMAAGAAGVQGIRPAVGMVVASLILAGCGESPRAQSGPSPSGGISPVATASAAAACSSGATSASPANATPSSASGSITGSTGWPPTGVAPQLVYAISTAGASHGAYSTETVAGQFSYTINGVAPGEYFVFSA